MSFPKTLKQFSKTVSNKTSYVKFQEAFFNRISPIFSYKGLFAFENISSTPLLNWKNTNNVNLNDDQQNTGSGAGRNQR